MDNFLYKINIFSLTESQIFNIIRRGIDRNTYIYLLYEILGGIIKEVDINENDIPTKKEI